MLEPKKNQEEDLLAMKKHGPEFFRHQVAGHFPFLYQPRIVFKPAFPSEVHFYCFISMSYPHILEFVPHFYGVMEFETRTDSKTGKPRTHSSSITEDLVKSSSSSSLKSLSKNHAPRSPTHARDKGVTNNSVSVTSSADQQPAILFHHSPKGPTPTVSHAFAEQTSPKLSSKRLILQKDRSLTPTSVDQYSFESKEKPPRIIPPLNLDDSISSHSSSSSCPVPRNPSKRSRYATPSSRSSRRGNHAKGLSIDDLADQVSLLNAADSMEELCSPRGRVSSSSSSSVTHQSRFASCGASSYTNTRALLTSSGTRTRHESLMPVMESSDSSISYHHITRNNSSNASLSSLEEQIEKETQDVADELDANPWLFRCAYKRRNKKLSEYIALEDITYPFSRPCVLDLKMGIRQHGVNASPAKVISQTQKCLNSTSAVLGMRVCGMQVFQPESQSFIFRDKYFGRRVNEDEFMCTLYQYFHNGKLFRGGDLIPAFLARLRALYAVLSDCTRFRFYSSSLLFVYEGDETAQNPQTIDARLIDFAHTYIVPNKEEGPDEGLMFGLENLISLFSEILEKNQQNKCESCIRGMITIQAREEEKKRMEEEALPDLSSLINPPEVVASTASTDISKIITEINL